MAEEKPKKSRYVKKPKDQHKPTRKPCKKYTPEEKDQVVRDALGKFAEGGRPVSSIKKGEIQEARALEVLELANTLHKRLAEKRGDPVAFLERAIRSMAPIEVCLEAVGIRKETYHAWMKEVEDGGPRAPYLEDFFDAVKSQRALAMIETLEKLKEIGHSNDRCWPSLAWLLERTEQKRFVVQRNYPQQAPAQTNVQVNVDVTARDALSTAEDAAAAYRARVIETKGEVLSIENQQDEEQAES